MTIRCYTHDVVPSHMNSPGLPDNGGFVKGMVTYIVTDNLEFKAMTTKEFCTLLNKLSIKDVTELDEVVVEIVPDEGLKLLKASTECKTVLTSVFFEDIGKQKTTQN
ncbi:hypothetical protein LWI29_026766 [Acer saccharum]|uniref:Uncharacterized protein n=1 Tax=Acer saccharum TaxID=4024 RepID=A0AA39S7S8_ACESA|nr:hypothetical protein LWI29_026766 [Acer saccharum]